MRNIEDTIHSSESEKIEMKMVMGQWHSDSKWNDVWYETALKWYKEERVKKLSKKQVCWDYEEGKRLNKRPEYRKTSCNRRQYIQ